jgi:hypothetical protein
VAKEEDLNVTFAGIQPEHEQTDEET